MRRRTLLGLLPAAALAGCVGGGDPGTEPGDGSEPGGTATVDPPPYDEIGCPTFDDAAEATVCAHTADATGPVLEPERPVFRDDEDGGRTFEFVVRNRTTDRLEFNPYDWRLHRRTDDGWTGLGPDAVPQPITSVEAGGLYRYRLATIEFDDAGDADRPIVADLAPGATHAFSVTVAIGDERVELVCLFRYVVSG